MPTSADADTMFRAARYSAPALEKGLDILETLAEAGEPLSTRAIAERLSRSKSEIFRMVSILLDRGYLTRESGSDRLLLTSRLLDLGVRSPTSRQLLSVAVPAMERLCDQVRQSAHLAVLNGGDSVLVAAVTGGADMSYVAKLGYSRRAVDSTSGLIILAYQSEATRRCLVEDSIALMLTKPDRRLIDEAMSRIRFQGYEIAKSRDVVGITDIGAPILDSSGRAIASVLIPHLDRVNEPPRHDVALQKLQQTCAQIASELW